MPSPRRFPPPWTIEESNNACFIVRDKNGQALAYVYFEDEPGRGTAASLLTHDEARRIAANIAKLLVLLLRRVGAKACFLKTRRSKGCTVFLSPA